MYRRERMKKAEVKVQRRLTEGRCKIQSARRYVAGARNSALHLNSRKEYRMNSIGEINTLTRRLVGAEGRQEPDGAGGSQTKVRNRIAWVGGRVNQAREWYGQGETQALVSRDARCVRERLSEPRNIVSQCGRYAVWVTIIEDQEPYRQLSSGEVEVEEQEEGVGITIGQIVEAVRGKFPEGQRTAVKMYWTGGQPYATDYMNPETRVDREKITFINNMKRLYAQVKVLGTQEQAREHEGKKRIREDTMVKQSELRELIHLWDIKKVVTGNHITRKSEDEVIQQQDDEMAQMGNTLFIDPAFKNPGEETDPQQYNDRQVKGGAQWKDMTDYFMVELKDGRKLLVLKKGVYVNELNEVAEEKVEVNPMAAYERPVDIIAE